MNKGGKFIFGKSLIRNDLSVYLPPQAIDEYNITSESKVYLFTGSKSTGGFCVTRKGLLYPSKIGNILKETPVLCDYELSEGEFVKYKGRSYCWLSVSPDGMLALSDTSAFFLELKAGMEPVIYPKQRYCVYNGRKGSSAGKSGKL